MNKQTIAREKIKQNIGKILKPPEGIEGEFRRLEYNSGFLGWINWLSSRYSLPSRLGSLASLSLPSTGDTWGLFIGS